MASETSSVAEPETGANGSTNARHQLTEMVLPQSHAKRPLPIGQPGHKDRPKSSSELGMQGVQSSPGTPRISTSPGDIRELRPSDAISSPPPVFQMPDPSSPLQDQLNHSCSNKVGLCVICSCTNPKNGESIVGCTAPNKMNKCFGNDLGYSVIEVPSDTLSRSKMEQLLRDLGRAKMPKPREEPFRFFFYFFGHGNSTEICLTDGNFERSRIITEVKKIDKQLCKIVLFDSCRLTSNQSISPNEERKQYPKSVNTLVIHANEYKSEAFYSTSDKFPEMKGCGLVTYFFTELAPALNQPLSAVLTEVRGKVDEFIQENTATNYNQMLVFEDRLMENVNLLAESKGQERVRPSIVHIKTAPDVTTVQWVFRLNVDKRIKSFRVNCRDEDGEIMDIKDVIIMKNVAEYKNYSLLPNTKYWVRVFALYEDEFESESEESFFTTCGKADIPHIPPNSIFQPTGVVLGNGAYGDVLEVLYKEKVYAAKKYRFTGTDFSITALKAFGQEHEMTRICFHPNVVPYYCIGKLETDKSTVVVMERMDKDLAVYLKHRKLELPVKFKILNDIANGLHHLHQQNPAIIHRDLKASNVLMTCDGVAKISDFGNSRIIDESETAELLTSKPGTIDYMPPEAGEGDYDKTLDIFSYGHLAIYILLEQRPQSLNKSTYYSEGRLVARTEVERREKYMEKVKTMLKSCQHPFYLIMVQCLENEKTKRPSCRQLLDCIEKEKLTDQ